MKTDINTILTKIAVDPASRTIPELLIAARSDVPKLCHALLIAVEALEALEAVPALREIEAVLREDHLS